MSTLSLTQTEYKVMSRGNGDIMGEGGGVGVRGWRIGQIALHNHVFAKLCSVSKLAIRGKPNVLYDDSLILSFYSFFFVLVLLLIVCSLLSLIFLTPQMCKWQSDNEKKNSKVTGRCNFHVLHFIFFSFLLFGLFLLH